MKKQSSMEKMIKIILEIDCGTYFFYQTKQLRGLTPAFIGFLHIYINNASLNSSYLGIPIIHEA